GVEGKHRCFLHCARLQACRLNVLSVLGRRRNTVLLEFSGDEFRGVIFVGGATAAAMQFGSGQVFEVLSDTSGAQTRPGTCNRFGWGGLTEDRRGRDLPGARNRQCKEDRGDKERRDKTGSIRRGLQAGTSFLQTKSESSRRGSPTGSPLPPRSTAARLAVGDADRPCALLPAKGWRQSGTG